MSRRFKKALRFLFVFLRQFRGFLITVAVAFAVSTLTLYYVYPKGELPAHHHTLLGIAYDTLLLTFFETPIPFVDDWRLVPVFFGLPILGLLVIIDGAVRLGNLLLHHKRYSREWQQMVAAAYEDHIIVCGLGNVGIRVVEHLLRFDEDVVCIEKNAGSTFLGELEQFKIPVLIGDATNTQVLEQAGIRRAKGLIAVTDKDLCNLETALSAKELNPGIRVVMRMFDQKLARKVGKSLGVDSVFSTSALSAPVFAQSVLSNSILSSFEFAGSTINAFQMVIHPRSPFIGRQIDDIRAQYEITVLMHERASEVDWNPPPTQTLAAGDRLLIMTTVENVRPLLEAEQGAVSA